MTRQQLIQNWDLVEAFKNGAEIEFKHKENAEWTGIENPSFCLEGYDYRIKPSTKLRPWKPEEVPVGARICAPWMNSIISWCERRESNQWFVGCPDGTPEGRRWNLSELHEFTDIQHSTDGGKTWKPCGVEE